MTSREPFKSEQKRIQPNRIPRKAFRVMQILYAQFSELLAIPPENRPRGKNHLNGKDVYEAAWKELEAQQIECGPRTFNRAKKMLGIRAIRIGGIRKGQHAQFIWTVPTHSPEQVLALSRSHRERALDARQKAEQMRKIEANKPENHWATITLRNYMLACGCSCPAMDVRTQWMGTRRSCTQTLFDAKKVLSIVSIKKPDGWVWVYPAPAVEEWLIAKLEKGPIPVESLIAEAEAAGWSYDVLNETRKKIGGIRELFIMFEDKDKESLFHSKRVRHWFDVSVNPNLALAAKTEEDEESEEENG